MKIIRWKEFLLLIELYREVDKDKKKRFGIATNVEADGMRLQKEKLKVGAKMEDKSQ